MKTLFSAIAAVFLVCHLVSCGEKAPQRIEVTLNPAGLKAAFKSATPEVRKQIDQALGAIASGDPASAMPVWKSLQSNPDLTKDQRDQLGRASVATLQKVQTLEAAGDQRAQAAMERYQRSK